MMHSAGEFGNKPSLWCKIGLHRWRKTWTIGMSRCLTCGKWMDRL